MVAQTVERVRPRRRPHQQRADVPAARADRRGDRARRRRLLHVGREGHAVGDAGRVPAHAATRVGPHRQLRVVDGHHRRPRLRRVQRVEGSDPRAHAHRGARVGGRRHRRQRDRAGGGRRTTARPASRARATASSSRTARWAARAIPSSTSAASPGSSAPTLPLPHRPHVHGRRRRVHVGVTAARGARRATATGSSSRRRRCRTTSTGRAISTTPRPCGCSTTCGSRTCVGAVGEWWPELHRANTAASSRRAKCTCSTNRKVSRASRSSARCATRGAREGAVLEQRLVEATTGRAIARAWVVQLLVQDGTVVDWPERYFARVAEIEGARFRRARARTAARWGPPGVASPW